MFIVGRFAAKAWNPPGHRRFGVRQGIVIFLEEEVCLFRAILVSRVISREGKDQVKGRPA
jgi:hypothetical protein